MKIEKMTKEDIPQCLELLKQLTISGNFDYEEIFEKINSEIFVAKIENKVVGMASIFIEQKLLRFGGKVGHIEDVVVDSDFRGKGIGKKLLEHCISVAKENNCYKVILDCDIDNSNFYNKCGFLEYGVCMRKNL